MGIVCFPFDPLPIYDIVGLDLVSGWEGRMDIADRCWCFMYSYCPMVMLKDHTFGLLLLF